jgi:hypothetical protein
MRAIASVHQPQRSGAEQAGWVLGNLTGQAVIWAVLLGVIYLMYRGIRWIGAKLKKQKQ